jgi:hypothetical protein
MKDYQDIDRLKKRMRALVGPRPASQHFEIFPAKGSFQGEIRFLKIITEK